jgi:hypothetical protein
VGLLGSNPSSRKTRHPTIKQKKGSGNQGLKGPSKKMPVFIRGDILGFGILGLGFSFDL